MSSTPQGASTWETEIWAQLSGHIESERDIMSGYAELAEQAEEPEVRYLIRLILDDEARHHRIFLELANALRGHIEWREIDPSVPDRSFRALPKEVIEKTKRFIAAEKTDASQLEKLHRNLRSVADTTLWSLLVELMELDTKKHLRILEYISKDKRA
jgi:rubrerythrin